MIKQCVCVHVAQDKIHGKGKRVANLTDKGDSHNPRFRCSVCGADH
jgi:hypothetical protein